MIFRLARPRWSFAVGALALAVLAASLTTRRPRAEVEHPRQQWLRDSTAGLFLHWGMFTAPAHTDCAAWEHDVTAGGWTADYWVDEARKLTPRTSCWPPSTAGSAMRGRGRRRSPAAAPPQRDFLGELVNAGKAKGVTSSST